MNRSGVDRHGRLMAALWGEHSCSSNFSERSSPPPHPRPAPPRSWSGLQPRRAQKSSSTITATMSNRPHSNDAENPYLAHLGGGAAPGGSNGSAPTGGPLDGFIPRKVSGAQVVKAMVSRGVGSIHFKWMLFCLDER
jgi:hypothetical protein